MSEATFEQALQAMKIAHERGDADSATKMANLAKQLQGQATSTIPVEKKPEFTIGKSFIGAVETARSLVQGLGAAVAGGFTGIGNLVVGNSLDETIQNMSEVQEKLAFSPESAEGQAIASTLAAPLQWIDEKTFQIGSVAEDIPVVGPGIATTIKVGTDALIGQAVFKLAGKGMSIRNAAKTAKAARKANAVMRSEMAAKSERLFNERVAFGAKSEADGTLRDPAGMIESKKTFRREYLKELPDDLTITEKKIAIQEADEAWSRNVQEALAQEDGLAKLADFNERQRLLNLPEIHRFSKPIELPKPKDLPKISGIGQSMANGIGQLMGTVVTNLDRVDPTRVLSKSIRKMEGTMEKKMIFRNERASDFYELSEKMYKSPRAGNWHKAYLRQDWDRLRQEAHLAGIKLKNTDKTGVTPATAIQSVRDIIKEMGSEALDVNFKNFTLEANYMPRHIDYSKKKALMADPNIRTLMGEESGKLDRILHKDYSDEFMRYDDINKAILQGTSASIPKPTTSFVQKRKIKDPSGSPFAPYYQPMHVAMKRYVDDMTEAVEIRRFLGQDKGNLEDSLGAYLDDVSKVVKMDVNSHHILRTTLSARFKEGRMHANHNMQTIKNIGYIFSIGNLWSALTQIGDVVSSMRTLGLSNTISGVKGALSPRGLRPSEIGYDDIMKELASPSKSAKALDAFLRYSGFKTMDRFGKRTIVNASKTKWSKIANSKNGRAVIEREYGPMFKNAPEEFDQFVLDLAEGNTANNNVKLAIFNDLADLQPITLSDMPISYLKNPNGRVLWALKTWSAQQLNTLWRHTMGEYRRNRLEGKSHARSMVVPSQNLLKFVGYNIILGTAGVDTFKQFIAKMAAGEDITPEDVQDNVAQAWLKTALVSKYTIDKTLAKGDIWGTATEIFSPSLSGTIERIVRASNKDDPMRELIKILPLVGPVAGAIDRAEQGK